MYKRLVVMLVLLFLPMIAHGKSDNPWEKKLPFGGATITYALSGSENGSEILYIRDGGRLTAKYHKGTMKILGMAQQTETLQITDPDWIYTFDLMKKTGTKKTNPQKYMIEEYNKLSNKEKQQVKKNGEDMATGPMMAGMNVTVVKKAKKILGYECDSAEVMGSTVYTIHDSPIALLSETNMMGMKIRIEATDIDTGTPAKKFFKHPEGITPVMDKESDAMARSMAKQTMDMLKDPEGVQKAGTNSAPAARQKNQEEISPEEQQEMEEAMEMLKGIFGGKN